MRLLVFDPRVIGHHLEYLRYLAQYAVQEPRCHLHLVVHPRIDEHAPDLVDFVQQNADQLTLLPLTPGEFKATEEPSIFWRALAGWDAAARRAEAVAAEHCVFMEMNFFQPALGLPRARRASFKVSGILFFPYCRIEPMQDQWRYKVKSRLERFRKYLQLQWVLSNPQMENIFVLNDPHAAAELNKKHNTAQFRSIPDPVVDKDLSMSNGEDQDRVFPTDDDRVHFLIFGSLREQKGVRQVISAAIQLRDKEAEKVALHFLGKARSDLQDDLPELVEQLRASQPGMHVHYEDRYLPYRELESALKTCDVVLAPYQQTEGSSGVIGHAAKHKRPVIGPKTGLIGELIQKYDLGIAVNASDPEAIAMGMRHYLRRDGETTSAGMRRYVEERTPQHFARTLLQTLSGSQ